jgi:hypothetical protein
MARANDPRLRPRGPEIDEVTLLPTQEKIAVLAARIGQAYTLRYPEWTPARTSVGVWETAASGLLMLHRRVPTIPIDPELFVAVQPLREWADPWADVAQGSALRRYRRYVSRIVKQLRAEIEAEVRRAERRVRRGEVLGSVVTDSKGQLSALGRYVLAHRAGRDDLAERFRPEAERQHRSCPFYQQACSRLLSRKDYPLPRPSNLLPGLVIPAGLDLPCFSMN